MYFDLNDEVDIIPEMRVDVMELRACYLAALSGKEDLHQGGLCVSRMHLRS